MKVNCQYCGSFINDTDESCPSCGAVNENLKRVVDGTPKTIAELELWYRARKLPPYEKTRFFIGIDYKKPRAFGIYEENGRFIVYKNKADGSRAIRYEGTDEAYAVNEIFLKLKSEILNQKAANANASRRPVRKRSFGSRMLDKLKSFGIFTGVIIAFCVIAVFPVVTAIAIALLVTGLIALVAYVILSVVFEKQSDKKGLPKKVKIIFAIASVLVFFVSFTIIYNRSKVDYYNYNDQIYCSYHGDYYVYDDYYGDYTYISYDALPVAFTTSMDTYAWDYDDSDWDESASFTQFKDSDYYDTYISPSSSDSDSSWDWDSGSSWDSGGSDWDSDW